MSKELVIGSNRHETKVAVLEDDQLVEVFFQRANEYSLAGSIHKGRVTRVLPGMQSAFVDLGLERDTFLYVSDFFEEHPDVDTLSDEKPARSNRTEPRRDREITREGAKEPNRVAVGEETGNTSIEASTTGSAASQEPVSQEGGPESLRERRGRRSRRRRSRGRGFPENKYAQPPVASQTLPEAVEESVEEQEEEALADVIVLPGESLAKYRNSSVAAPVHETAESTTSETETPETESAGTESPGAEVNEPKSKGGRVAVSGAEQDVTHDTGKPEAHARDLRYDDFAIHVVSELDDEAAEAAEARAEEIANIVESQSAAFENGAPGEESASEVEVEFITEQPEDDSAVLVLESESEPAEIEAADSAEPPEANEPAIMEQARGEAQSGEVSPAQTASVREKGGRYLQHRMSRRMRRRRGKFNPQLESEESVAGGTPAVATAVAAGEARSDEVKQEREDRDVKSDLPLPSITDLLKPGQEIIVQIAKEPLGQKGARITSHVALPGRYVVYMPSVEHLGVSRKIASDEERHRLKRILQAHRVGTTGGFIIRTAGEGRTEDEIAADMNFLYNLWLDIRQKAEKKPAPALLHHDLDVVQRILRDQVTDEFKAIWVDQEEMYENVLRFIQRFQPSLVSRVKMYTRKAPIFDAFNITQELEKALRPKVWLKSGGYIVINQTEALVAIDVNTGKFVGKSNRLEDTIVKTNTEAVKEIVRQIRLRDLGGIIVVDFIDMDERKNRQKVMQALEEAMRADKAPYKVLQFNDFGLVAITRKRVKQSLERTLCAPCPYCEGAGYVKSVQTVISEILIEAQKVGAAIEGKDVMLRCNPEVAKTLKSKDNQYLEELEEILKRPVLVKGDVQLHLEKFDLV
jgi:Rne/Rng family ribonuclease